MIHGAQVLLRPVEERDHVLIHAWQNDPEVWWLMDYEGPFSMQDIVESEQRARAEGDPYVIEVDGTPIGRIGLNAFRRRDRLCSLYVLIGDRSPGVAATSTASTRPRPSLIRPCWIRARRSSCTPAGLPT